ncbi:energy-coupling factor transporter ATPase [Aliibacillus thermotolerans]|uniref:Energy-coupling factor transporter ATPase n=1 Tax=Aliibacillus thermotolerans TaxID=1834418 RepID=A0ABW0U927_9BACI|nr:energy-coupling factor transporter ATPase [Aliibacillus thermotolerans]MDA3128946.1 energy-coupling factor transporter ATPase [Aliibacillus thermotolerans]
MEVAVKVDHVFFRYEDNGPWVLQDVHLNIKKGEWVTFMGRNGSGKSTFARMCNALFLPTKGRVMINGRPTDKKEYLPEIRRQVGMVFQNPDHQFVAPTVRDDIAFGMENAGLSREEMIERINRVAKEVQIHELLDKEPHRLSGGQKQRVAIAGILALEPKIIVFDEATSMLDPKGRKDVLQLVKELHTKGLTILSVTHHLEEALLSDRFVYMEKGNISIDIPTSELFSSLPLLEKKQVPLPYRFALYRQLSNLDEHQMSSMLEELMRESLDQ